MRVLPLQTAAQRIFFGILLVGLIVRLVAMVFFHPPIISDAANYNDLARNLLAGKGYWLDGGPYAYRTPGYPFILAGLYTLFGIPNSAIAISPIPLFQAGCDVLSCALLYLIGKRLYGVRVAQVAAIIFALLPLQFLYELEVMSETIFTTFLLLSIWLAIARSESENTEATKSRRTIVSLLLGLVIGYGTLIRPVLLLLPIVFVLYDRSMGTRLRENIRSTALLYLCVLCIVGPWMYRNYETLGHFSLTSNEGENFWIGHHESATGSYHYPAGNPLDAIKDDFARSDQGMRLAWQFISEHPVEEIPLTFKKIAYFFSGDYYLLYTLQYQPRWNSYPNAATVYNEFSPVLSWVVLFPFDVIILLGIFGLTIPNPVTRKRTRLISGTILYWLVAHIVFFTSPRYRFPVNSLFMLAAAYACVQISAKSLRTVLASFSTVRKIVFATVLAIIIGGWTVELVMLRTSIRPVKAIEHTRMNQSDGQ